MSEKPASRDVGGTKSIPGYRRSREMSLDKRLGVFGNKHGWASSSDLLRQMAEKSECYASPLYDHERTDAKGGVSSPELGTRKLARLKGGGLELAGAEYERSSRPRGRPRKTPINKEVDNRGKRPGLRTSEPAPATPRVGTQPKTPFHRYRQQIFTDLNNEGLTEKYHHLEIYCCLTTVGHHSDEQVKAYTGRRVRQDNEFGVSDAKWQYYETSKLVLSAPGWVGNTCHTTCIPTFPNTHDDDNVAERRCVVGCQHEDITPHLKWQTQLDMC
uniref:Uncharacterized protein n=1 Tax=Timema tahoe TaxID=61484 RepID=A0A7R9ISP6_9NEOP|nr:unnamed protein product [Timema tahoe]